MFMFLLSQRRQAAIGPGCVKTQKRPPVIVFKLANISDEPYATIKSVIDFKVIQLHLTLHLISILAARPLLSFHTAWAKSGCSTFKSAAQVFCVG